MPRGFKFIVAQNLFKTLQQNSLTLEIFQATKNTYLIINILSLWLIMQKKKSIIMKTMPSPENNNSYWDIIFWWYAYVASKCGNKFQWIFFIWRNFGNDIVDHVEWKRHCAITKKMSEFRDISNITNIRFTMVYRTIIGVILHLFIICYSWLHNFPFF